jgi:hypothetical protein
MINIGGGVVESTFAGIRVHSGAIVNISGGTIDNDFDALSGSMVNLIGQQFILDGVDITSSLTPNVPMIVTDRNVELRSLLLDGSWTEFDLNTLNSYGHDSFHANATLTVTLDSGDANRDGSVDAADYVALRKFGAAPTQFGTWRANFSPSNEGSVTFGDFNSDGATDAADYVAWRKNGGTAAEYNSWRTNFGRSGAVGSGNATADAGSNVPEPSLSGWLLLALATLGQRQFRIPRRALDDATKVQAASKIVGTVA